MVKKKLIVAGILGMTIGLGMVATTGVTAKATIKNDLQKFQDDKNGVENLKKDIDTWLNDKVLPSYDPETLKNYQVIYDYLTTKDSKEKSKLLDKINKIDKEEIDAFEKNKPEVEHLLKGLYAKISKLQDEHKGEEARKLNEKVNELRKEFEKNNYKNARLVGDDLNAHWEQDGKQAVAPKVTEKAKKRLMDKILDDAKQVEKSLTVPTSNDKSIKEAKLFADLLLQELQNAKNLGVSNLDTIKARELLDKYKVNYKNLISREEKYKKELLNKIEEDTKLPLMFLEGKSEEKFRDPKPVAARLAKEVEEAKNLGLYNDIVANASNVVDKFDMDRDYKPSKEKAKDTITSDKSEDNTKTTNSKTEEKEIVTTGSKVGTTGMLAFGSILTMVGAVLRRRK